MRGFWNDPDGLTVVDILAITLGLGSFFLYWKRGTIDANFADIIVAVILAAAGQKVGEGWVKAKGKGGNGNNGSTI